MRPAEKAWLALAAGVIGYEIFAEEGELMSEAVDRWLMKHPAVTTLGVVVTAMHLLNWIPKPIDPFHLLSRRRHA